MFLQLTDALKYLHQGFCTDKASAGGMIAYGTSLIQGVVHRDIKPENILLRAVKSSSLTGLEPFPDVVLADFGHAVSVS